MALSLNHYSIRTRDLAGCERFYCGLLGLQVGPRPDFPFPGLWLYAGDPADWANACVHIIGIDPQNPEGLKQYLGDIDVARLQGSGAIDHVAFFATGLSETLSRLQAQGLACRERTVPGLGLHQVFVDDPNGIVVELNFPAAEQATLRFLAAPTDVNWGGKTHGGTVMRWIDEAAHVLAETGSAGFPYLLPSLDRLAPARFETPAGSSHAIDSAAEAGPTVEVRVQALFGLDAHPTIGRPPRALLLSLTSPGGRPMQLTTDLPAFWRGSWRDVVKDMKGRYPRHRWPDEPWREDPSLKTRNAFERTKRT